MPAVIDLVPAPSVPPTVSDVAPTARLMPPEQPKAVEAMTVSHQVARSSSAEDAPESAGADKLHYEVQGANETLWEIAKKQLGGGQRWMEISRLNPDLDAKQPVPAGTVLRMPSDADRSEEPVAATAPLSRQRGRRGRRAVGLAVTGAPAAVPFMCQNSPPAPEPQRATLIDAQPAPPSAEPPQALHNEGSTPPAAPIPTPETVTKEATGRDPRATARRTGGFPAPLSPPPAGPGSPPPMPQPIVSAPQPAPPSPPAATAPPPATPVATAPNAQPAQAINPPVSVSRPACMPLPELMPSVPKTQVERRRAPLPITGTFPCDLVNDTTVKLPARLQQQTDKTAVLYVALGPDQQSVWVYTPAALERLSEQLEKLPGGDERVRRCRRLCFSRMEAVEMNHSLGCVVLPPEAGASRRLERQGGADRRPRPLRTVGRPALAAIL